MMGHFEYIGPGQFSVFQHALFDGPLDIAAQQECVAAIAKAQDEGVVVLRRIGGDIARGRCQHFDLRPAECQAAAFIERHDPGASFGGLFADQLPDRGRRHGASPDLPGMKIFDQGRQTAGMIFVSVGEGDHIHGPNGAVSEVGPDIILAHIELRTG